MSKKLDFFDAVKSGDLVVTESLLKSDPNLVNERDDYYEATPLHYAAELGHKAVAERLIEHGADINARDRTWEATPAGWAVEYLVERGALLGTQIDDLIHAIKTEQIEWVRRFLKRNRPLADSNDAEGTAFDHATKTGNDKIIELVKKYRGNTAAS